MEISHVTIIKADNAHAEISKESTWREANVGILCTFITLTAWKDLNIMTFIHDPPLETDQICYWG